MNGSASMNAQGSAAATPPASVPDADDTNANSNGKKAMDRDKGQARAEDRRNDRDADDRKTMDRDAHDRQADADKDAGDRGAKDNDSRGADAR